MKRLLERVNQNVLVWTSLLGLVGAGWGAGLATAGFRTLPRQVAENTAALNEIKTEFVSTTDSFRVVHAQIGEDMQSIRTLIRTQLCLELSDREHTDWRRCQIDEVERLLARSGILPGKAAR